MNRNKVFINFLDRGEELLRICAIRRILGRIAQYD